MLNRHFLSELKKADLLPAQINLLLVKGFYPRVYAQNIEFELWFTNYISTYVEKDVCQVLQISDVVVFQRFLKLCAARVGNLVNYSELARDADISPNTAKSWLSVLEASYIIKLLYPYYKNYNKRVVKSPKLYFYDTALVCALLGIKEDDIQFHPMRGALFESFVISELFKYNFNHVLQPQLFFWRDVQGNEIDCMIEKGFDEMVPIEIKAGMTITEDFFKRLVDWQKISEQKKVAQYIVYGGTDYQEQRGIKIFTWDSVDQMCDEVYR